MAADFGNIGEKVYDGATGLSETLVTDICMVTGIATMELDPETGDPIRILRIRSASDVETVCVP